MKIYSLLTIFSLSATAWSQGVGVNETGAAPDASAILDAASTDKGFLPPRMTDAQRANINNPAEGLVIYNTTEKCLQWYDGVYWYSACSGTIPPEPMLGSGFTNGFQNNTACTNKLISVTPCSFVAGATLNDDAGTADGLEYDWVDAASYMNSNTTQALVEVGGQCWYRRNADNIPSAYNPIPTWVNVSDLGWSGYYTAGPFANEGRLYQWSAAMNGSNVERAQGVCPTGWHVPSDCEWMYLENTLGMSVANQIATVNRNTGDVGSKLSTLTNNGAGTNSSGFTALFAGRRNSSNGAFANRDEISFWWSSSTYTATDVRTRTVSSTSAAVQRPSSGNQFSNAYSLRCLKD